MLGRTQDTLSLRSVEDQPGKVFKFSGGKPPDPG